MKYLLALFLLLPGCAAPLVASVLFEGSGLVKTDTNALIAVGTVDGVFEVYSKAGGLPAVLPVSVNEGEVYLYNRELDISVKQPVSEPLPAWALELFRPGELETIAELYGLVLTSEG